MMNGLDEYNKWTTRDGRILHVSDMSTSHLINAVALFERKGWHLPSLETMRGIINIRGGKEQNDA